MERHVTKEMVDEIKLLSNTTSSDLANILRESLVLANDKDNQRWKPPCLSNWDYFDTCIAIGHFDPESGDCEELYWNNHGELQAPGGRDVKLRRVHTYHEKAWFDYVVMGILTILLEILVPHACGGSKIVKK
jgi:hypothetical protein